MKLLSEVEPKAKVTIKSIEGGKEVERQLDDLGVKVGVELEVLSQTPAHEHRGAISLKTDQREVILGQGMAEKIYLEKEGALVSLLELEKGDSGVVKALRGGKEFKTWVTGLGIDEGVAVKFLEHASDDTLIFEIEGKTARMGEGLASRILVEHEGTTIQANYLKEGEKAKIARITNEVSARKKLEDMGIREGSEITLTAKEEVSPHPVRGKYTRARIGEEVVTIGHGLAQKVWVE